MSMFQVHVCMDGHDTRSITIPDTCTFSQLATVCCSTWNQHIGEADLRDSDSNRWPGAEAVRDWIDQLPDGVIYIDGKGKPALNGSGTGGQGAATESGGSLDGWRSSDEEDSTLISSLSLPHSPESDKKQQPQRQNLNQVKATSPHRRSYSQADATTDQNRGNRKQKRRAGKTTSFFEFSPNRRSQSSTFVSVQSNNRLSVNTSIITEDQRNRTGKTRPINLGSPARNVRNKYIAMSPTELQDELWRIFSMYCVQGTAGVDRIVMHQFYHVMRDCDVIGPYMSRAQCDVVFVKETQGQGPRSKNTMSFDNFLNGIKTVASMYYDTKRRKFRTPALSEENAFREILLYHILPYAYRWDRVHLAQHIDTKDVDDVFQMHHVFLVSIFRVYTNNHTHMAYDSYLRFCKDAELDTLGLTVNEIAISFLASKTEPSNGDWISYVNRSVLSLPEFVESIGRCALMGLSKSSTAPPAHLVKAIFLHMAQCRRFNRPELGQGYRDERANAIKSLQASVVNMWNADKKIDYLNTHCVPNTSDEEGGISTGITNTLRGGLKRANSKKGFLEEGSENTITTNRTLDPSVTSTLFAGGVPSSEPPASPPAFTRKRIPKGTTGQLSFLAASPKELNITKRQARQAILDMAREDELMFESIHRSSSSESRNLNGKSSGSNSNRFANGSKPLVDHNNQQQQRLPARQRVSSRTLSSQHQSQSSLMNYESGHSNPSGSITASASTTTAYSYYSNKKASGHKKTNSNGHSTKAAGNGSMYGIPEESDSCLGVATYMKRGSVPSMATEVNSDWTLLQKLTNMDLSTVSSTFGNTKDHIPDATAKEMSSMVQHMPRPRIPPASQYKRSLTSSSLASVSGYDSDGDMESEDGASKDWEYAVYGTNSGVIYEREMEKKREQSEERKRRIEEKAREDIRKELEKEREEEEKKRKAEIAKQQLAEAQEKRAREEKERKEAEVAKAKMEQEIEMKRVCALVERGDVFMKHGRKGKPHARFIQVSADHTEVYWADTYEKLRTALLKGKSLKSLPISSITKIGVGCTTQVFSRTNADETRNIAPLAFSLVAGDRTLDLVASNVDMRTAWVYFFQHIIGVPVTRIGSSGRLN